MSRDEELSLTAVINVLTEQLKSQADLFESTIKGLRWEFRIFYIGVLVFTLARIGVPVSLSLPGVSVEAGTTTTTTETQPASSSVVP